jgi:hypothetical protein
MRELKSHSLKLLDQSMTDFSELTELRGALELVEKCCLAVQRKVNLAEAMSSPGNRQALLKRFGKDGHDVALQLILRLALKDFQRKSFTVHSPLDETKIGLIYRAVGGWTQFDAVVALTCPDAGPEGAVHLLNPRKQDHWRALKTIAPGTLVNVYLRSSGPKRSHEQERLACQRYKAIFEAIESQTAPTEEPRPVVKLEQYRQRAGGDRRGQSSRPRAPVGRPSGSAGPVFSFKVVVSKIDTFIHAGNAQLIISHMREFPGTAQMYVLRDERKRISLDADSIWSAEIRNGEIVLFEFYGHQPGEQFLKELAGKVNKYTQMDKLAHQ